MKSGSLSSEALCHVINTIIAPNCYSEPMREAGHDVELMPSFDELMQMLDLNTIIISTV